MKLKHTLLTVLYFLFLLPETFAQKGLSIGVSANYLYSYRRLKAVEDDASSQKYIDSKNNEESPLYAKQFSLDFLYQYKNNMNLSFGMSHSDIGYRIKDFPFDKTGNPHVNNFEMQFRVMRVSLPIMLGYTLALGTGNKHAMVFRLGFNNHINYAVSTNFILHLKNGEKEQIEEKEVAVIFPYNLSAFSNIGYYYQIRKHHIGINLIGSYDLTPLDGSDHSVNQHLYYGGIGLSYLYSFQKY